MMTFGYAKDYYYTGDSTLMIRVRIPSIHGPYNQQDAGGQTIRNYVKDEDLPYFQSIQLPHHPKDGEVVLLASTNDSSRNPSYIVIGTTGASYSTGRTIEF